MEQPEQRPGWWSALDAGARYGVGLGLLLALVGSAALQGMAASAGVTVPAAAAWQELAFDLFLGIWAATPAGAAERWGRERGWRRQRLAGSVAAAAFLGGLLAHGQAAYVRVLVQGEGFLAAQRAALVQLQDAFRDGWAATLLGLGLALGVQAALRGVSLRGAQGAAVQLRGQIAAGGLASWLCLPLVAAQAAAGAGGPHPAMAATMLTVLAVTAPPLARWARLGEGAPRPQPPGAGPAGER